MYKNKREKKDGKERKKEREKFRIFKCIIILSIYILMTFFHGILIINDKNLKSKWNKLRIIIIKLY